MKKITTLVWAIIFTQIIISKDANCTQPWRPLPGGLLNERVTAITSFGGYLWVGGDFTTAGPISAGYVVRHDGFSWIATPTLPSSPYGFAVYNNILYALGGFDIGGQNFGMMKWMGAYWQPMAQIEQWGRIKTSAVFGGELFLGGFFYTVNGVVSESIIRYNGTTWSPFAGPISCFWIWPARINDIHIANGSLYICGAFDQIGGMYSSCAVKWNGTNWTQLNIGWNTYASAFVHTNNSVYVCGIFPTAGSSTSIRVAKEGPNGWVNAGNGIQLLAFTAATYMGKAYVAGSGAQAGGDYIGNCGYWNGANWVRDNQGIKGGTIMTLYTDDTKDVMYAGGDFAIWRGDTTDFIAYKGEISLPVELTYFRSEFVKNAGTVWNNSGLEKNIKLEWQTMSETNADYFALSVCSVDGTLVSAGFGAGVSIDSLPFENIGNISAHGTTSQINIYERFFSEKNLPENLAEKKNCLYYFRLEQFDWDGALSGIWYSALSAPSSHSLEYLSGSKTIVCGSLAGEISIYSSNGQLIEKNRPPIFVSEYLPGVYCAVLPEKKEVLRFIVQ